MKSATLYKLIAVLLVRRDPEQIAELFAKEFALVEARRESHITPGGSLQRFAYALLRKRGN